MADPLLAVRRLTKRFGQTTVLHDLSLSVARGHIVSILGRSGSGKSTLLRCVAGLERPDQGQILIDGRDITAVPTHRRGVGMMFQQFALFPHRSVSGNIAFGLRMRGDSAQAQRARVEELLELVGLRGYGDRSVFELSGGEQQRVALARSLAPNPPLLLLDEPMSSLDQSLKERLIGEVRAILSAVGITALYVTHDQHEAFAVADWLVLLEAGEIVQEGVPEEAYRRPVNRFAARFFGIQNIVPVEGTPERDGEEWVARTPLGALHIEAGEAQPFVALPAESAEIVDNRDKDVDKLKNLLRGVVKSRSFRGGYYELGVEHPGGLALTWEVESAPAVGDPVTLRVAPSQITFVAP